MPSLAELQKNIPILKLSFTGNPSWEKFQTLITFLFLTQNLILMKLDEILTLILYFRDFFGLKKGMWE